MKAPRLFPRWGILVIDLVLCLIALAGAYQLRFNFHVPEHEVVLLLEVLPLFLGVRFLSFLLAGQQRVMVRHTNTDDAKRIFLTVLFGSLAFGVLSLARFYFLDGLYFLPRAVIIIDFMGTAILLIASRIVMKLLYLRSRSAGKDSVRVIIHGAGEAGLITKRTLERAGSANYSVEAFVDDDPSKAGKSLESVIIHPTSKLSKLLGDVQPDQVIIAIQKPDPEHRRRVVDACMNAKVRVLTIPPVSDWINGQLSAGQIREVNIEDLLGRQVIHLDEGTVRMHFTDRRVLVTGAAGSIGSELARQLATMGMARLVLFDQAESALYDLEMELRRAKPDLDLHALVGDVRDPRTMETVLAAQAPEVLFHAAAYKHVPLMEAQPNEAVRTNIGGTRVVADLAVKHGVKEFVLISTDKAVNPTSVMGASKRVAELCVRAMQRNASGTRFVTTRFGNVLGSSGSVIPLFRRQIAAGGPVTVTDPEVTRYFMTIPEACRLVLEAATMGRGGEIYVFDMGDPVRIQDLAERMIRLSGKEPGIDIAIVHTGLRPGEKRYEELLASKENTLPTHHPTILIGKDEEAPDAEVQRSIDALIAAAEHETDDQLVARMKALVPEYRSNNSVFSALDGTA